MNHNNRVPFENYGRFYAGKVFRAGQTSGARRVLCFVTHAGALGASSDFSRAEAFNNARRAENGQVTFSAGSTAADTLKNYLAGLGFPVRSAADALDDASGAIALQTLNSLLNHA